MFEGRSENNKIAAASSDWLKWFCILLCKRWTEFNETWHEARFQRALPSLCFRVDWKNKMTARRPIGWNMYAFSSETAEQNSIKLYSKQDGNVLYKVFVFRADRKNKMTARLLIGLNIFEFNETWHEARTPLPLPSSCFSGRPEYTV